MIFQPNPSIHGYNFRHELTIHHGSPCQTLQTSSIFPVLPVLPVVKFGQGVGFLSHHLGWLAHNAHRALRLVPLGLDPMGYDGDHPTHRLDLVRPRFRGLTRLYT